MYSTLQRLYTSGKLSMQGLTKAVSKGWITAEQYATISGEEYTE
jgi:Phage uncharacterised protein (Phage_XkdX)